jgi:xanthine dehydrogenase iron-sulfur cluster and FAD-binding subunit A
MPKISLRVNGKARVVDTQADVPLLYVLRNDLEFNGPKFGCGMAQCGACADLSRRLFSFSEEAAGLLYVSPFASVLSL